MPIQNAPRLKKTSVTKALGLQNPFARNVETLKSLKMSFVNKLILRDLGIVSPQPLRYGSSGNVHCYPWPALAIDAALKQWRSTVLLTC